MLGPRHLGPATATFTVTYHGFSLLPKLVFEAAVNIWASAITSPMPIHIDATWSPLGKTPNGDQILGSAGPSGYFKIGDRQYPTALAEAICRRNSRGANCDYRPTEIFASFASDNPDWYFGTNGLVPPGQSDFETVVLHELGHGLGFAGGYNVQNGKGYSHDVPLSYDDRVWSAATGGHRLDDSTYPSGSTALAAQLTDGDVWFGGPATTLATGQRAKLYAPSPWQPGSSISHLDEATYKSGTADALMTPSLSRGEVIHVVSRLTLAVLNDIGWDFTPPALVDAIEPSGAMRITTDPSDVKWQWDRPADVGGLGDKPYIVQLRGGNAVNGSCRESFSTIWKAQSALFYTPFKVENGSCYRVLLKLVDLAGNVSDPYTGATYLVDQSPPTAKVHLSESAATLSVDGSRLWMSTPAVGATFKASYTASDSSGVVAFFCNSIAGFTVAEANVNSQLFTCTYTAVGNGYAIARVQGAMRDAAHLTGLADAFTTVLDLTAPTATVAVTGGPGITVVPGPIVLVGKPAAGATFQATYSVTERDSGMDHVTCPFVPGFTVVSTGGGSAWTCTWTATGSGYDSTPAKALVVDKVGNTGFATFQVATRHNPRDPQQ